MPSDPVLYLNYQGFPAIGLGARSGLPQKFKKPTQRSDLICRLREGRVFAAPSTWSKLTREREWLRPRQRVYPAKPKIGIRASGPNDVWHVDTTIFRLLDGTRLYLHGIIDNYSRRILSWRLKERFEPKVTTCELLREAAAELPPDSSPPTLMVDSGVENLNEEVDLLVAYNLVRRVVAQIEVRESNSMIES